MSRWLPIVVLSLLITGCSRYKDSTATPVADNNLQTNPTDEDRAVAFVEKLGGTVGRDKKLAGNPITIVDLSGEVTDTDLQKLAPLKNLTFINLMSYQVTDAGLKELAKYRSP